MLSCRLSEHRPVVRPIPGNRRRLIRLKVGVRNCVHKYVMNKTLTLTNEVICPVCGRPMILLHTIRRVFGEHLNVFKCKPCGFSMTEPVSWTTPPNEGPADGANQDEGGQLQHG
jgi:predicted RNA-binding Zn-ribbon protein involved in translation (DUF1610 family)